MKYDSYNLKLNLPTLIDAETIKSFVIRLPTLSNIHLETNQNPDSNNNKRNPNKIKNNENTQEFKIRNISKIFANPT